MRSWVDQTSTSHSDTSKDDFSIQDILLVTYPFLTSSAVPPPLLPDRGQWYKVLYPVGVSSLRTALSLTDNQVSQIVNKSAFKSFTNSTKAADLFRSDLAFKLHIFNDLLSLGDIPLCSTAIRLFGLRVNGPLGPGFSLKTGSVWKRSHKSSHSEMSHCN